MFFDSPDLKQELEKERRRNPLLNEAFDLIRLSEQGDNEIISRLKSNPVERSSGLVKISSPDKNEIYSLIQIKAICLKFRLRFLDTRFFRNEIPYEAILRIKELERKHGIRLEKFKIAAPSSAFNLIDRNKDPLLFADLGNGNYLLVHQWGKHLAWHRKIFAWSVKNFTNLATTIFIISLATALFAPVDALFPEGTKKGYIINTRMFLFLLSSLGMLFFSIYVSLMRNKNFSETEWNSRFLS